MINIAILISSLDHQAPVFVVKDLINGLLKKENIHIELFYLDDLNKVRFPIIATKISILEIHKLKKFDIVHTHGIRPDILTNMLPKSVIQISTQHNIIYNQFSIIYNKLKAKIIEFIWISALRRKKYIVAIGEAAKLYYEKKLPNTTIVNINNGRCPVEHLLSKDEVHFFENLKNNYKVIGSCTRAVKLKGHAQIIKALVDLPDYCFVLIGDGDYLKELQTLAKNLNVSDRCFFNGYKNETYGYLQFFDIYAMTSYSESVSIALIEAASAKKNIVCSNIDANLYLFSNEEVSFFDLDDITSLKNAICHAFNNKEQANKIYQKYQNMYTTDKMVEDYYRLYLKAIANKKKEL